MAINISRAERMTLASARGGTDEGVAPGSYNVPQDAIKAEGERPVPFSSGVDKVCCPNLTTSGYTPGPGHYVGQIHTCQDSANGLGPIAFRSKSRRIGPTAPGSTAYTESSLYENPGPGTYGLKIEWELALKKPPKNAANPWREKPEKTVPSIPLQKLPPNTQAENSMGSDISNLTMRHTGETRDHVGPGEYDPKVVLTTPSQPQTSFTSGGSKKDRTLWEASNTHMKIVPKENPGPGAYASKKSMSEAMAENEKAGTYQFASKTSMPHQKEQPDNKLAPGPGQYEALGHIEKQAAVARAHSNTHGEQTKFGSAVKRIGWSRPVDMPFVDPYHIHHVPGPGSYPVAAGTFPAPNKDKQKEAEKAVPGNKKKRFHGVHHPMIVMALQENQGPLEAFGSTDDRHCNKVQGQATPAPWAYNKEEARGHSMTAELREKKKIGRSGAFGCLADRFYGSPLSKAGDGFGDPGMSETHEVHTSTAHSEPRSAFASQTPRMQAPSSGEIHAVTVGHTETPGPGQYDNNVDVNYRSPFRHPKVDHLSFASGQDRFDFGRDLWDEHQTPLDNPAPGEYSHRLSGPARHGAVELRDKRKLAKPIGSTTADVGPGSYGSIDTPMLKKTFNVSTTAPRPPAGTPRKHFQSAKASLGF